MQTKHTDNFPLGMKRTVQLCWHANFVKVESNRSVRLDCERPKKPTQVNVQCLVTELASEIAVFAYHGSTKLNYYTSGISALANKV